MITQFRLENFRGFHEVILSNMKPITLISGKNNTGKTSLLEGVFLLFDHISPDSFSKINNFRGEPFSISGTHLWESAFYKMKTEQNMCISAKYNGEEMFLEYKKDDSYVPTNDFNSPAPQELMNHFMSYAKTAYTLQFRFQQGDYQEEGHFIIGSQGGMRNASTSLKDNVFQIMPLVWFMSASTIQSDPVISEWVGKLELQGNKHRIVEIMQYMDPSISDISTIAMNGMVQLYIKSDGSLIPLKLAGDGLNKLLYIVLAILENPGSIILIDEIENGFHYSMHQKMWDVISRAALEYKCQVIATTHSYECITGAVESMQENGNADNFCYYRLGRENEKVNVYRYSDDLLCKAIDGDMEVR